MPKRSRSHQLEAESIRRFEQALPSRWVCRRKDQDYGVDLEVEVFDDRNEATGLIFLVQIKATDDPAEALSVAMKMDRLLYLGNLDCPSIIVRYCSVDDRFHWKWFSNVVAEIGQSDTKTVTIRFSEADASSAADQEAIVRTLKVYRTIRLASRQLSIGLGIDERGCDSPHSFELRCAVAEITSSCRIVGTSSDPSECLPVVVHLDGEYLRARIDVIASIAVHLNCFDRHEIAAQLSYVLAHFASGYQLISQARDLATLILQRRFKCQSRHVAAAVAARLCEHPILAGNLAALNGIHECQDEAYLLYVHSLLSSSLPFEELVDTVSRFYADALEFHATESPERQSAIHYSFGNVLRISGAMSRAVRQYNLARRKFPDYLRRGYFLAELAAALYFRGRYRMAATLYEYAYETDAKPQVAICAGDAHLFCGHFAEARRCYETAANSGDIFESSEAALKAWMVNWVEQFSQHNHLTVGWASPNIWMLVLEQSAEAERSDHAFGACLMLCYLTEDNLPFWAQAISLAIGGEDPDLLFPVIASAVWAHGQAAYALFRDRLVEQGGTSDALRSLDEMVWGLFAQRASSSKRDVTTRLFP
ncbi:MAG: DUF4365 domain-containing protein [Notoacmeibacter sp.]|nr:DUF4365 domain-containing protein [Notoacmeibacter sp.]